MFRSLLVPLDGSPLSERALPMALNLSHKFGAALEVVRVHEPAGRFYGPRGAIAPLSLDRELRELNQEYLAEIVDRIGNQAGGAVRGSLLDGPVIETLAEYAAGKHFDLVVMTTRGRSTPARWLLGSVADALVRQATIPLLLVPAGAEGGQASPDTQMQHILVPLDGSELAEQILEPAMAMADATQSRLTLLSVIRPMLPERYPPTSAKIIGPVLEELESLHEEEVREAQAYVDSIAEQLRARSLSVATAVVTNEQPAAAILEYAATNQVDLIALATQGRGGMKRLLLGSVADKILRAGAVAVLVQRPSDQSAAGAPEVANEGRWLENASLEHRHDAEVKTRV